MQTCAAAKIVFPFNYFPPRVEGHFQMTYSITGTAFLFNTDKTPDSIPLWLEAACGYFIFHRENVIMRVEAGKKLVGYIGDDLSVHAAHLNCS